MPSCMDYTPVEVTKVLSALEKEESSVWSHRIKVNET